MKKMITLIIISILACGWLGKAAHACTLVAGVVPQFEQRRLFETWMPILKTLEYKTGCKYMLEGSSSIDEFETKFQRGLFDLVYLNPYHAIIAYDAHEYEPIIRDGREKLQGILVVSKDSPIKSIHDLKGKKIAFPSPNALGASLLMRAELAGKYELEFETLYVKTHSSVYLHVAKSLVDAGGGVERSLTTQNEDLQDMVRIIYKTQSVPAHPIAVHPRVPGDIKEQIRQAFFDIGKNNPALLADIPINDVVPASIEDYKVLKTLNLKDFAAAP